MMHITISQWQTYINDELTEIERIKYENHLYECDQCLAVYLEAIADSETILPTYTEEVNPVDTIISKIPELNNKEFKETPKVISNNKNPKKKQFYASTTVHYFIAAAMTLLLMASGLFSSMTGIASSIEQPKQEERLSFTDKLLNKTFSVVDEIDNKIKDNNRKKDKNKKEVGK